MSYKMMCELDGALYVAHDTDRGVLWTWFGGTMWYAYDVQGEQVEVRTMPDELIKSDFDPREYYNEHISLQPPQ